MENAMRITQHSTGFAVSGGHRRSSPSLPWAQTKLHGRPSPSAVASPEMTMMMSSGTVLRGSSGRRTMPRLRLHCRLPQQAVDPDMKPTRKAQENQTIQGLKEKIKQAITNVSLSVSAFDTAWVAMVPSPDSPLYPCFPECLQWILKNQNPDGSWTLHGSYKYLVKDSLSSTLACVLALKRWNIGEDHIQKGIEFIQKNAPFTTDSSQHSPIGFTIIFTRMLQIGKQLGLEIPISEDVQNKLFSMRDEELNRKSESGQWTSYLAYIVKGLGPNQDYEELRKFQNENGSLFNSPSSTAAMLIHIHDPKAMEYLHSAILKFGNAVPVVYPSDMYARLYMVDSIEKLGVARHFSDYIKNVLDETYRAWIHNEDELLTDISTYALAFRLLRMHGYDISFEIFADMDEEKILSYKVDSFPQNVAAALELYKVSQIEICEDETTLKKLYKWSKKFLSDGLTKFEAHNDLDSSILQEVDYSLGRRFVEQLDRLEHRRNIENFKPDNVQCLKASFRFHNFDGADLLKLAVDDYNYCLSIYQKEFQSFQRWAKETKMDEMLRVNLIRLTYSYFSAAATIIPPELSDARLSWAKNSLLVTVIDDIFDVFGSKEERENFLDLLRRWDPDYKSHACSEQVYAAFHALYTTIEEMGATGALIHGYPVISHMIEAWVDMVDSFNVEAEWRINRKMPTMEQYIENGYIAAALGPMILISGYFVGPKLSWDIIRSQEYQQLYYEAGIVGRLTNDTQGVEREAGQFKPNSVSITMHQGYEKEDAIRKVWDMCDASKNKVLGLTLNKNGSVVPRPYKELFWNMCRVLYFFYRENDGFRMTDSAEVVNIVMNEPISVSSFSLNEQVN